MAGFREFVTGEVLTAANVDDFLAKQAVMKFADAAARDAALGTAVAGGNALREGMVAYLDDTDEVQFYDGTAWDAISQPPAGIGSNVVQTVKTDTFSTTSTSLVDITGLTVTITPSSATSKILVLASLPISSSTGQSVSVVGARVTLLRDSTNLSVPTSPGSRVPAFGQAAGTDEQAHRLFRVINPVSVQILDSPATTSAVAYKAQMSVQTGTGFLNRDATDSDAAGFIRTVASLTVIEVAA